MSGSQPSRFQSRFGYAPTLRALSDNTGTQAPLSAPSANAPAPQQPAAPAPSQAAPQMPAAAPVYAGAQPVDRDGSNNDAGFGGYGEANAGMIGPGPYGTLGSTLGGLAGLATGVPGLGLVGGAIGTGFDVAGRNSQLSELGQPTIGLNGALSALGNNVSWGAFGRSANDQFVDAFANPHTGTHMRGVMDAVPGWANMTAAPSIADKSAEIGFEAPTFAEGQLAGIDGGMKGDAGSIGTFGEGQNSGPDGGSKGDTSSDPGGVDGNSWQSGGYTGAGGDGVVQPDQPAGTVHEGEQVISAPAAAYYGPELFAALNARAIPRSVLAELARLG